MINILEIEIINCFKDFLILFTNEDKKVLKSASKNQKTENENITLLSSGYLFGFKENNKNIYVFPNELLDIYNEYITSEKCKEHDLSVANMYVLAYISMNGILEIKYIKDLLINEYVLNITEKEIDDIISTNYETYKNKYYIASNLQEVPNNILDELIKSKKKISSLILTEKELFYYLSMIKNFTSEIFKILKKYKGIESYILFECSILPQSIKDIVNKFKFNEKESKKVLKIIEKYENNFRYWIFNGRTTEEYDREYFINNYFIDSKPKVNDLKTCFNNIPEELLEFFMDYYEVKTIDSLTKEVIKYANEIIETMGFSKIEELIDFNHDELTDNVPTEFLKCAFAILYKENETIKYFIPNEILDIFKNQKEKDEEFYITNLISGYININGVIEKEKLLQLLKDYYDIEISIEKLDSYVKEVHAKIIDQYYTYIVDCDIDDINRLMIIKNKFNKYKKFNFEYNDYEDEFKILLRELICSKDASNFKMNELYEYLIFLVKNGSFSKNTLNFVFEGYEITLKKDLENEIMSLYNQYKKYISVWQYNGYTLTEYTEMNKVSKVGRNDPCPCGSGKKYKKCCGI